ncbi:hypothetical protein [Xanthocytophaga flava]|uniref:hypothetical protein n=1 Tax=Xanthocytophaga flava TaxID=3048013 RepID=UPI0028D5351B|nr:hypothetical protein [Xanthocytophaga flavus]MDJ1470337.1 hypothetical protein [Xanthocytophaga flavus]
MNVDYRFSSLHDEHFHAEEKFWEIFSLEPDEPMTKIGKAFREMMDTYNNSKPLSDQMRGVWYWKIEKFICIYLYNLVKQKTNIYTIEISRQYMNEGDRPRTTLNHLRRLQKAGFITSFVLSTYIDPKNKAEDPSFILSLNPDLSFFNDIEVQRYIQKLLK